MCSFFDGDTTKSIAELEKSNNGKPKYDYDLLQTWNSLPADIRSCVTLQTFKRHLKTHLFPHS